MKIKKISEKHYRVKAESGVVRDVFLVTGSKGFCTCPDFVFRGGTRPCKHIIAVRDIINERKKTSE